MRIFVTFLLLIFSLNINAFSQDISWYFDTDDSAFGQSAMADIDGDGKLEIVFGCYRNDSHVYAINAEDGSLLWKFNTTSEVMDGCNDTAPLIYDIDNDGKLDVIVASSCTPITYCFDGATGEIKWQTIHTRGSDSPPTITDLDGDGNLEILHGQFDGFVTCIDAKSGEKLWDLEVDANSWIQTAPSIVDIDNDGLMDFVVATWNFDEDDKIYAYRGYDQKILWSKDASGNVYHGSAIADIDKNGANEIILGDYGGMLWVLNALDGSEKWTYKSNYAVASPVSVGDIDGDGFCEVVFTSFYQVLALKHDGSKLWQYDIPEYGQSFRGVALSDFDDDGLPDVVFATDNGLLTAVSGLTGKLIWSVNLGNDINKKLEIDHAPIVGDMDGDGFKDVFVVGGNTEYPNYQDNYGRAYCVSTTAKAGDEWTMFQNNPERTSSICSNETSYSNNNLSSDNYIELSNFKDEIHLDKLLVNSKILVYDVIGNLIQKAKADSESYILNISNYTKGVYIIKIGTQTLKFIK